MTTGEPTPAGAMTSEDLAIERRSDHRDPPFHHMILYRMVTMERAEEAQYGGRRLRNGSWGGTTTGG
jgi:hypothetical protein